MPTERERIFGAPGLGRRPARPAPLDERPNKMSFGEQVVEAIGEHIDARISYAASRANENTREYANDHEVVATGERLQALLDRVRFK